MKRRHEFVTTALIESHNEDSTGQERIHCHVFLDVPAQQAEAADLYWYLVFDFEEEITWSNITFKEGSTTSFKHNCGSHALSAAGNGTYNYWMNDVIDFGLALINDCDAYAKNLLEINDLLYYFNAPLYHAAVVVDTVENGGDSYPSTIEFKCLHSPIIIYDQPFGPTFDLPAWYLEEFEHECEDYWDILGYEDDWTEANLLANQVWRPE
jgi:hypothetical protein